MALSKAEQLVKRYYRLQEKWMPWAPTLQDLADYILPKRKNILARRTAGTKQTERLFDSTAPDSAVKLAAFIAGSLTNMAIRWFSLKMRINELNEDKETNIWLEACAEALFLALRQSNFNTESQEFYLDLDVFGTGALLVEEKDSDTPGFGGFLFRTEAIGSYFIAENAEGMVNTIFRKLQMSVGEAANKWGAANLSEASQKMLVKDPDAPLDILHAVVPRHTAPGKLKGNKPYASYYVELDKKKMLDEGGYDEFPFLVTRWSKTSGEEYGRGPGHIALPDIMTLNKADELTLRGWGKIIDPPLKVRDDGVVGRVSTKPSSLITVRDMEALQPLEQGGKWDVNAALTQDRRASIRRMFYADQLQLPDKTIITATEVERRIELAQQILGPTMGRLEYEYLNPLISRCFKMLMRSGMLPPPPQSLVEYSKKSNVEIDVEYEGPLARAQRGGELQAINRLMTMVAPLLQLNPNSQILDNLDEDALWKLGVKVTGTSKALTREDSDRDALREDRKAQMQEATNREGMVAAGQTAKAIADTEATMSETQPQEPSPYGDLSQSPQAA